MGDRAGLTKLDRTNGYDDGRGYMKAKKSKLAQQNEQIREALRSRNNPMRTELFKGISINVNGRTQPTADELKRLILLNGGDYHPYYRYQTTKFMIATNLSMARIKNLRPDDRIVKPEWITDSIKAKCILPYQDYQLFEESSTKELQLTDERSNNSTDYQLKVPTATSRQSSNASTSTTTVRNSRKTNKGNLDSQRKQQATMESFVIRGATRPKVDDIKPKKPSTSKATNGLKINDIKSCFQQQQQKKNKNLANICGMTKIDDIIGLLNEWVGCPEGVKDEDTACVTKYFYDLMNEKDYHNKFYEIIYALQQRIVQHEEKIWIDLYNNLAETLKSELNQNAVASQSLSNLIPMIEADATISELQQNNIDNNQVVHIDDDATHEYNYNNGTNTAEEPNSSPSDAK